MRVFCPVCQKEADYNPNLFRCSCGNPWEPLVSDTFSPSSIKQDCNSVWRYRSMFGGDQFDELVSLGAGWTPMVSQKWQGHPVKFKLEYVSPTGSFKDRGTEVEMAFLKAAGVQEVVEDSSGNAGAAMAAYAGKADLSATIFAPADASPAKLAQIGVYGAELRKIPGPRIEATKAVLLAVKKGAVYASHAYNPIYLLGQQTFAWEIWEQTGGVLPDAVVIPVGQCGLLMGAWLGFQRLKNASVINKIPRLFAAQPEILSPIHHALQNDLEDIKTTTPESKSIADGLAIVKPVRSKRILQALRETKGDAVAVSEYQIKQAYFRLAASGLFAEPSSAVAAAAIPMVREKVGKGASILTVLTGNGLKTPLLIK